MRTGTQRWVRHRSLAFPVAYISGRPRQNARTETYLESAQISAVRIDAKSGQVPVDDAHKVSVLDCAGFQHNHTSSFKISSASTSSVALISFSSSRNRSWSADWW